MDREVFLHLSAFIGRLPGSSIMNARRFRTDNRMYFFTHYMIKLWNSNTPLPLLPKVLLCPQTRMAVKETNSWRTGLSVTTTHIFYVHCWRQYAFVCNSPVRKVLLAFSPVCRLPINIWLAIVRIGLGLDRP